MAKITVTNTINANFTVAQSACVFLIAGADNTNTWSDCAGILEVSVDTGTGENAKGGDGSGRALLIDESYNANPASMRAAIDLLGHTPVGLRGRRIAVLGDMLELGSRGERLHMDLAPALKAAASPSPASSG